MTIVAQPRPVHDMKLRGRAAALPPERHTATFFVTQPRHSLGNADARHQAGRADFGLPERLVYRLLEPSLAHW